MKVFDQTISTLVVMCFTSCSFVNFSKSVDWNWDPWSFVSTGEHLKIAIHSFKILLEIACANISFRGTTAGHLINWSIIVNRYAWPFTSGRGPTISICRFVQFVYNLYKFEYSFFFISVCMLGQTKWLLINLLAARCPRCERLWKCLKMFSEWRWYVWPWMTCAYFAG